MDDRQVQVLKWLESELEKSKGFEVANRIEWLEHCQSLAVGNYHSLRNHLRDTNNYDHAFKMMAGDDYTRNSLSEIVRHLHNYLVSNKSLVEHTRNSIRKWYSKESFIEEYQSKIKEVFTGSEVSAFIEELRNYCCHCNPIAIRTLQNLIGSKDINEVFIFKDQLIKGSSIKSGAKKYLKKFEEEIPLLVPIEEYWELSQKFNDWLISRLKDYHAKEIYESKWYVQAIGFANEGKYDEIMRSAGYFK